MELFFTKESLDGLDMQSLCLDYWTLCAIQELIGYAEVAPHTLQKWMDSHGYVQCRLSSKDGVFSLQGS